MPEIVPPDVKKALYLASPQTAYPSTLAKALELGKNKPHPMAHLGASTKLSTDCAVNRVLRRDETLKVEQVGHGRIGYSEKGGIRLARHGVA